MHGLRSAAASSAPPSKRASFATPLGKPPRSSRKIRLAVEGSHHVVESFGGPLPVLVTETLSRFDDASGVSVALTPSGWAWFAAGGKLLVWKYNSHASLKATGCRELPLPPSTFSSNTGVACILESSSQQDVSCLYSTADGYMRYWYSICREANFADSRIDLKGQQAKAVQAVEAGHAVLATDMSVLFLISLGETIYKYQELKSSGGGGMFSGISRRMSFIFGSNSSQQLSEPLVRMLTNDQGDIVMLSSGHLHKWSLLPDGAQMRYQCSLDQLLSVQISACLHAQGFTFTPIDMQWIRGGVVIVLSITEASASGTTHYVAAVVNVSCDEPPDSASRVTLLDYVSDRQDIGSATLRLVPPDLNSQQLYLISGKTIVCADSASGTVDRLRFLPAEHILGVCSSGGAVPVLYCLHDGIVCIKGSQLELNLSLLGSPMVANTPKRYDQSVLDDSTSTLATDYAGGDPGANTDIVQQIKAPFLVWLKDGQPSGGFVLEKVSLDLSEAYKSTDFLNGILLMSQQLMDDIPANDPRWAEESLTKQFSREVLLHQQQVQSVLFGNQLQEKEKAHDWFRLFLIATGILSKLLTYSRGREVVATLFEHSNKIAAAKALLDVSGRTAGILDSAVKLVIDRRGKEIARNLTPQDMFFRELSRIDDVFDAFIAYAETRLPVANSPLGLVKDVNSMLLNVAYCIAKHGETLKASGAYSRIIREEPACGRQMLSSLRATLEKQHALTLAQLPAAEDSETHATACQQLAELADAILADHAQCLSTSADDAAAGAELERVYHDTRSRIIRPFLALGQYERAAALAEKYCDFQLLIEICELTNNQRRLQHYQERYGQQGFSSVLFRYYVREGKQSKLLRLTIPSSQQMELDKAADQVNEELEEFLQEQGRADLSWLHDIGQEHFSKACQHLIHLANSEKEFLSKKKTLYSLGKLANLAADDADDATRKGTADTLSRINRDLAIILHQEQLPSYVIRDLGMDVHSMHVLTPVDIIEGYVGEHNASATEQDFLKALDLLELLTSSDQSNGGSSDIHGLRLHIWSRAVLRDDWLALAFTATSSTDLIDTLGSTIFMRLVDLLIIRSPDGAVIVGGILPTVQDLLSSDELTHLRADSKFCYMLQAAYEHVSQSLAVLPATTG